MTDRPVSPSGAPSPREEPPELDADVERLHRFVVREQREPREGREPVPWWFIAAIAITLFSGGFYLGRHWGVFAPVAHVGYRPLAAPPAAAPTPGAVSGQAVYLARCASCHQADGKGIPGAFPPLAGSAWVSGSSDVLVRIILEGMTGPIEVGGVRYSGEMPAWRRQLSDHEIAAVATYVRVLPGHTGAPPVSADQVLAVRQATAARGRPWTARELEEAR